MNANVLLLKNLIDVQIIFEIEQEELNRYYDSEEDVDLNHLVKRIQEVRELKLKYLTILN
jgi:hypothetical protein